MELPRGTTDQEEEEKKKERKIRNKNKEKRNKVKKYRGKKERKRKEKRGKGVGQNILISTFLQINKSTWDYFVFQFFSNRRISDKIKWTAIWWNIQSLLKLDV